MSIALLAPLGLAALAALVLPLVIHLVRRLELTTIEFAALRWISERMRPQHRLRFERPWLLLTRLALLTLLALLLAHPVWSRVAMSLRSWVVVTPGVALADARAATGAVNAEWHWLASRFPHVDEAVATTDIPIASLLRELDAQLPANAALTVIVPEQPAGLDGEHPRLSRAVDWRIVPGRMAEAVSPSTERIRIAVRYAPGAEASLRYLRAAVAAWNQGESGRYEIDARPADAPIDAATNWLIWLAPPASELTRWLKHGGVALVSNAADTNGESLWRDASGRVLAKLAAGGNGRVIALTGALTPAELPLLLDADFPDRLRAAFGGGSRAPTRATAVAMHPGVETATATGSARSLVSARPLDVWLALLIAALFLCERFVATRAHPEPQA